MSNEASESSGVQQLIDRLHHQGVEKGKEEADSLVATARQQAFEITDAAKRQADEILQTAREEAERVRRSGEEALRMAGRDAILELMESLREDFVRRLHHLVQHQLEDESFLKEMLLEISRKAVSRDEQDAIHLVFLGDADSDAYPGGSLDEFARALAADTVREGLTFSTSDSETAGIRVQFVGDDLEVDLTEETLTALLMKHLSPKFREILQTR
jgi:V/A-type H+-transporting ATPase subunit E